ncbi:nad dependent epimerase dehydratase [Trichoderma arundinaceum]|uniref:Nad dependent epimerase dehydratase n=1 Tax=Trichoderma arundinaceum TaxID=490622 RepID=A0A395NJF2_TRIAR|nr:nad dependent epimerase dehydratase [Trichoderma arundinaceum]
MPETLIVTGANGYVALHVIKEAISRGYRVIGTVRSSSAADKVLAALPDASSQLELVYVTDMTEAESFEKAFTKYPVKAVLNVASPLIHHPKDNKTEILDPAIKSGIAILEAAQRYGGSSFQRVIHVGSFGATLDLSKGDAPGKTYSPDDWNPTTYEEAAAGNEAIGYLGSKVLAEKGIWNWVRDKKPNYDLTVVNPSTVYGPNLGSIDLSNLNVSAQILWELVCPSPNPSPYNSMHMGGWVDVRDVAWALLAAVQVPEAGGERFLLVSRCHWQLIRDEARRVLPELQSRIDAGEPGAWKAARDTTYDVDGTKAERILGLKYRQLSDCLRDTYLQLLEVEKKQSAVSN